MKRFQVLVVVFICLLLLLTAPTSVQAQSCTWGDIICEGQQAIQQLFEVYVPMIQAWAKLQLMRGVYGFGYEAIHAVAGFMWSGTKSLITAGVGIGTVGEWISTRFFLPMIQMSTTTLQPVVSLFFFIAFLLLGCSYLLAAFIRLNVVNPQSMLLWWLAGGLFFSVAPSLFTSTQLLTQTLSTVFYSASLQSVTGTNPFGLLAQGDAAANNPIFAIPAPCSNFTEYLPRSSGSLNGLDVSLAFHKADGFDIVAAGDQCLGGGTASDLPRQWFGADGFFDAAKAPASWLNAVACPPGQDPCNLDNLVDLAIEPMRQATLQAASALSRLWQAIPLVLFGIVEQLLRLCLLTAQGLTFVSFSCAMLFAFFRRTEPIAWAVIDQWLSLIVQSTVIALMQGMIVALYLSAAQLGSPLILLAVSVVGAVLMVLLLVSALRAVWNSLNRLFESFGQATNGAMITPSMAGRQVGAAGTGAIGAGLTMAGGAASVVGTMSAGAAALGNGATWAQAAGVAFGGSKALDGAAYQVTRLPSLRKTPLGDAADQYVEGSAVRRIGESLVGTVPYMNEAVAQVGGAWLGSSLLTDRSAEYAGQPAMLRPQVGNLMQEVLSSPAWVDKDKSKDKPLALDNAGNLDETISLDLHQALATNRVMQTGESGNSLSMAPLQKLDSAGEALNRAADNLQRAARQVELNQVLQQRDLVQAEASTKPREDLALLGMDNDSAPSVASTEPRTRLRRLLATATEAQDD